MGLILNGFDMDYLNEAIIGSKLDEVIELELYETIESKIEDMVFMEDNIEIYEEIYDICVEYGVNFHNEDVENEVANAIIQDADDLKNFFGVKMVVENGMVSIEKA